MLVQDLTRLHTGFKDISYPVAFYRAYSVVACSFAESAAEHPLRHGALAAAAQRGGHARARLDPLRAVSGRGVARLRAPVARILRALRQRALRTRRGMREPDRASTLAHHCLGPAREPAVLLELQLIKS